MERLGANYQKTGPGILRKVPDEDLEELKKIFDVTGGTERYNKIEELSRLKAKEMGMQFDNTMDNEYVKHIYTVNSRKHTEEE